MTFIVALVTPRFALLASDTRLRVFDSGSLELLGHRDGESKLHRRAGRWFAGDPAQAARIGAHGARGAVLR